MPESVGIQSKAGFALDHGLYGAGPAIVYPDHPPGATQIAADGQIPFDKETLTAAIERAVDTALIGAGALPPGTVVSELIQGNIEGPFRYRGWERIIYCGMGFEQPDNSPATLAAGVYAHLFEGDDVLQDQAWVTTDERLAGFNAGDRKVRRGVLGFDKGQTNDLVFSSIMVDKIVISGTTKEVRIAVDLIGYARIAGSYNSANWTLPGASTAISVFPQATVKLGTRAAGYGALSTYKPSAWELTWLNNFKGDDITTESAPHIVQPERNAFRETTLKLDFPRYGPDAVTLQAYKDLGTEMAGFLELEGGEIAATGFNYFWGFYMSSLAIRSEPEPGNVNGPSVLTHSIEMQAHRPNGIVTPDIFVGNKHAGIALKKDGELVIVTQNEDTADYSTEV